MIPFAPAKVVFFTLWLFMPREHNIMGDTMTRGWVPVQKKMALAECQPMTFAIKDVFGIEARCFMDDDEPQDGIISRRVD